MPAFDWSHMHMQPWSTRLATSGGSCCHCQQTPHAAKCQSINSPVVLALMLCAYEQSIRTVNMTNACHSHWQSMQCVSIKLSAIQHPFLCHVWVVPFRISLVRLWQSPYFGKEYFAYSPFVVSDFCLIIGWHGLNCVSAYPQHEISCCYDCFEQWIIIHLPTLHFKHTLQNFIIQFVGILQIEPLSNCLSDLLVTLSWKHILWIFIWCLYSFDAWSKAGVSLFSDAKYQQSTSHVAVLDSQSCCACQHGIESYYRAMSNAVPKLDNPQQNQNKREERFIRAVGTQFTLTCHWWLSWVYQLHRIMAHMQQLPGASEVVSSSKYCS